MTKKEAVAINIKNFQFVPGMFRISSVRLLTYACHRMLPPRV